MCCVICNDIPLYLHPFFKILESPIYICTLECANFRTNPYILGFCRTSVFKYFLSNDQRHWISSLLICLEWVTIVGNGILKGKKWVILCPLKNSWIASGIELHDREHREIVCWFGVTRLPIQLTEPALHSNYNAPAWLHHHAYKPPCIFKWPWECFI